MEMKKLILTSMVALAGLSACSQSNTNTPETTVSEQQSAVVFEKLDADAFEKAIADGQGVLVDVRTPGEYAEGHIPGSTNIDWNSAAFEAEIDKLDKQTPVYLYCRSGGRSGRAAEALKAKGFTQIYDLTGGFMSWSAQGKASE